MKLLQKEVIGEERIFLLPSIDKKYRWFLVEIAFELFPFGDVLADDQFIVAGEVAGHTELGGGMEVLAQVLNHGVVAERRLDEKFGLIICQ